MKRFITTTAFVSILATGAFAATDFDTTTINKYIPELDVSTLTDEQAAALVGIATSADEADKERQMRAYVEEYTSPMVPTKTVVVTPEEAARIEAEQAAMYEEGSSEYFDNVIASYLPDVDLDTLSDEQKAALIAIASSEDEGQKEADMRAYLAN